MFELVQCWSKECAAGVGGRDVVVVSLRFPNIQTIHMPAERDSSLNNFYYKHFPKIYEIQMQEALLLLVLYLSDRKQDDLRHRAYFDLILVL